MNNVSALGKETFCSPGSGRAPAAAFPGQGRATRPAPGHRQFGERTARRGRGEGVVRGEAGGRGYGCKCAEGWAGWGPGCRGRLKGCGRPAERARAGVGGRGCQRAAPIPALGRGGFCAPALGGCALRGRGRGSAQRRSRSQGAGSGRAGWPGAPAPIAAAPFLKPQPGC